MLILSYQLPTFISSMKGGWLIIQDQFCGIYSEYIVLYSEGSFSMCGKV